jgi:hypothetical protein
MRIPIIRGTIDRRILVNYRVAPDALAAVLPEPFRPQVVKGFGIAGVCLIRLTRIRPRYVPGLLGVSSENAAHRIAVEWEAGDATRTGVYIPRRDTSSRLNTLAGGRLFPGVHRRAHFRVAEHAGRYEVAMESHDGKARLCFDGCVASALPAGSVFGSIDEASAFFQRGSLGYSPKSKPGSFDGLELRTCDWHMEPLAVEHVDSSFFSDRNVFPDGSVRFDSAFLMRGIAHEWHAAKSLCRTLCAENVPADLCGYAKARKRGTLRPSS